MNVKTRHTSKLGAEPVNLTLTPERAAIGLGREMNNLINIG
jgi:hypothetical protein